MIFSKAQERLRLKAIAKNTERKARAKEEAAIQEVFVKFHKIIQ